VSQVLKNDRFLRALRREPVDRTPVWIMRQAGRYLPEYRRVRAQAGDFLSLCSNPELACEVTLQPIDRFGLDAAILFSDILTLPNAMGLDLRFETGEGPVFSNPVRDMAAVQKLAVPDPEQAIGYVMDAVRLIVRELDGRVPLIGFAGSPWTVGTYVVEGGSSKTFSHIKAMMYAQPAILHQLLNTLALATTEYLAAQIEAGASAVMVFDTWGGVLTPATYREFSLRYMGDITQALARRYPQTPVILFTKNGGAWLEGLADTGCAALGVDWTIDLSDARARVGDRVALQGNLDPSVLYSPPDVIRREVGKVLQSFGHGNGHVFNLGHGVTPEVDPENVGALVEAVRELSPAYHKAD
jgi:uroporphyrinogen decarboxylase